MVVDSIRHGVADSSISLPPEKEDGLTSPVRVRASNVLYLRCGLGASNKEEAQRSIAAVG